MAADLHQIFGDEVAILHSALSDDERAEQWKHIRNGESHIVVGTRSAVFAPVPDLALIVVDEEHDHSYKQEETPRYHARDVAVMRAKMSMQPWCWARLRHRWRPTTTPPTANTGCWSCPSASRNGRCPRSQILDMREEFQRTRKDDPLSRKLVEEIGERLERNEQVMVLLNRRGYSSFVLCRELWRDGAMQELRDLDDVSQARAPAHLPLLRIHAARAEDLSQVRQRVCAVSRHRRRRSWKHMLHSHVPAGPHCAAGSRHGARPRRPGAHA